MVAWYHQSQKQSRRVYTVTGTMSSVRSWSQGVSIADWGERWRWLSSALRQNISCKGLDLECSLLRGCEWLTVSMLYILPYLTCYLPCTVSNVAAMRQDKGTPAKLPTARVYFLPSVGEGRAGRSLGSDHQPAAPLLALPRYLITY